jgi:hypothetical protein
MTEHLHECPRRCTEQAFCACRSAECICERLRACEERFTAAAVQRVEALEWAFIHSIGELITRAEAVAAIKGDQP